MHMLPNKTDLEESRDVVPFRLSQVLIENCLKTGLQKSYEEGEAKAFVSRQYKCGPLACTPEHFTTQPHKPRGRG